ncbi:hypothetical protein ACLKA7_003628 [Drosophila subpalustris]
MPQQHLPHNCNTLLPLWCLSVFGQLQELQLLLPAFLPACGMRHEATALSRHCHDTQSATHLALTLTLVMAFNGQFSTQASFFP